MVPSSYMYLLWHVRDSPLPSAGGLCLSLYGLRLPYRQYQLSHRARYGIRLAPEIRIYHYIRIEAQRVFSETACTHPELAGHLAKVTFGALKQHYTSTLTCVF